MLRGHSGVNAGQGLAEHDDDEKAESFDERVGDGERGSLRGHGGEDHCGEPREVGGVDQAPGSNAGAERAGRPSSG